jgi:hypothetical protein
VAVDAAAFHMLEWILSGPARGNSSASHIGSGQNNDIASQLFRESKSGILKTSE